MSTLPLSGSERAAAALAAPQLAAAAWVAWSAAGRTLPVHFDLYGRPDRFADAGGAALGMVGETLAALMIVWMIGATLRDPLASEARRRGLNLAQGVVVAVVFCMVALHVATALDLRDAGRLAVVAVSMILMVSGAVMGRVPPNALVGVRTPWSLSSRLAWDRANRLAGRLLTAAGAAGLAAAFLAPPDSALPCIVVAALMIALIATVESWRVWRTDPERRLV